MVRWWRDARLWVKGLLVLALPVAALLAMGIANLVVSADLADLSRTTTSTSTTIATLDRALELTLDAETGVRGYAATGNVAFLAPYNRAIEELSPLQRGATIDGLDRAQTVKLRQLGTQVFTVLTDVRDGVSAGTLHGAALDRELLAGKRAEDGIRTVIRNAEAAQREELADQQARVDDAQDAARIVNIVGMVVGILAGLLAMLVLLRGMLWRLNRVNRNVENFVAGRPITFRDGDRSDKDEIGHLEVVLLGAADLLAERERELQAARDEAVAATEAKDQFLGRMSHELRTPLTAILGFGQLLQLEELDSEDADSVDHIVSAGEHLLGLIEDLLDISRIETNHLSLSLEPIDLDEVVEESVALMGPQAADREVTVEVHGVGPGVVRADRQRLKQVLLNLLSNAIKYNRVGGKVSVTWKPEPEVETVAVTVEDTGIGIRAENVGRLFQPFDRLGAEASGVEGTGVGLSLSKALTEAMAGTIAVDSDPGVGSSFTVTLPAAELEAADDVELAVVWDGRAGRGGTVLYAEDNLATLRVVERLMGRRPEHLEVAIQGNLVLDLAKSVKPTLVLLDLHLPDMSGEDVLRELKADPATADIPVAILSADASEGQRRRLLGQGAVAYLTKPLQVVELLTLLDRTVGGAGDGPGDGVVGRAGDGNGSGVNG